MLVQLDHYVGSSSGYGDDHYCNVFSSILGGLVAKDPKLAEKGTE